MKFKRVRANSGNSHDSLKVGSSLKVMGSRTSGGEIIGILKLKDDMPAALANSLKADEDRKSDHTTLVQVKEEEEEEVVTHTATTETNLWQGDLGVEVDSLSEIPAGVAPAES